MLPYWYDAIVPDLLTGATVLVAAHGNSLRALVKHLDDMDPAAVVGLNIPTGIPLRYDLDESLRPVTVGGAYLDPDAAAAAIEAVKNQGRARARWVAGERRCVAAAASSEVREQRCERTPVQSWPMASKKAYVDHLRSVPLFSACTRELERIARSGDEIR